MKKYLLVYIILLFLFIDNVHCFIMEEDIDVFGEGQLYARTNLPETKDMAQGIGEQDYSRQVVTDEGMQSMHSSYSLKPSKKINKTDYYIVVGKDFKKKIYQYRSANRYQLSMTSPTGLNHRISIVSSTGEGVRNLSASGDILFTTPLMNSPTPVRSEVMTNYLVEGSGNLSEVVTGIVNGRSGRTIAETYISGSHFKVHSGISDSNVDESDAAALLASLNSITIPTEYGASYNKDLEDLNRQFDEGIVNKTAYMNQLEVMLKAGNIDAYTFAKQLKEKEDKGKINNTEYNAKITIATQSIADKTRIELKISRLNDAFSNDSINQSKYITDLKAIVDKGEIDTSRYLKELQNWVIAGKISTDVYKNSSTNALDEKQNRIRDLLNLTRNQTNVNAG